MAWTAPGAAARAERRRRFSRYLTGFSLLCPGAVRLYSGGSANNALAGGWLLFAFIGTGSSFLAFAALAAKHQIANPGYAHKSLHYLGG
jgi:hypothetical protein